MKEDSDEFEDFYESIEDLSRSGVRPHPDEDLPLPTKMLTSELKKHLSVRGGRLQPRTPLRRTSSCHDLDRLQTALQNGEIRMKTPPVPPKIDPDPSKPVYRVRPLPTEPPPEAAAVNDDYVTPVMCARPFSSINDIPESVGGLSIRQVGDCLRLLKLERYVDIFVKHDIDGTLLTTLDDAMLTSPDFNLSRFEANKLVRFINGWRPKD